MKWASSRAAPVVTPLPGSVRRTTAPTDRLAARPQGAGAPCRCRRSRPCPIRRRATSRQLAPVQDDAVGPDAVQSLGQLRGRGQRGGRHPPTCASRSSLSDNSTKTRAERPASRRPRAIPIPTPDCARQAPVTRHPGRVQRAHGRRLPSRRSCRAPPPGSTLPPPAPPRARSSSGPSTGRRSRSGQWIPRTVAQPESRRAARTSAIPCPMQPRQTARHAKCRRRFLALPRRNAGETAVGWSRWARVSLTARAVRSPVSARRGLSTSRS
jgi:hypothetical protein